jgi:hypothetical protein
MLCFLRKLFPLLVIVSRNLKALKEALQEIDNTAQEIGFMMNREKPKYMRVSTNMPNQFRQMAVGGYRFERVFSFPDLGSVISDDSGFSFLITKFIL